MPEVMGEEVPWVGGAFWEWKSERVLRPLRLSGRERPVARMRFPFHCVVVVT